MSELEQPKLTKRYKDMTLEERKQYRDEMKAFRRAEQEKWDQQRAKSIAEQQQRAEAARVEEVKRRKEMMKPKKLRIINKCLIDVLAWMPHHRGHNWVARAEMAPTLPGGIKRRFFNRASGKTGAKVIIPDDLEKGEIIEFGADYVSGGGRRETNRVYAVVLAVSATELYVKPYEQIVEAALHKTS